MRRFYKNHILSTLIVLVVLIAGALAYTHLAREKNPSVSFHWVIIQTSMPGANALAVESLLTNPIEQKLKTLTDVSFMISQSQQNMSDVMIRFQTVSESEYASHLQEIKNHLSQLSQQFPSQAQEPNIIEINSANTFPSATLFVEVDEIDDGVMRTTQKLVQDIHAIPQVYQVSVLGGAKKCLDVLISPNKSHEAQVAPGTIINLLQQNLDLLTVGTLNHKDKLLPVHSTQTLFDVESLSEVRVPTSKGILRLKDLGAIQTNYIEEPIQAGRQGKKGFLLSVMKKPESNLSELVNNLKYLMAEHSDTKTKITLIDDQSVSTEQALTIMNHNALIGMILVLLTVGIFLGFRISFVLLIAIPVIFAGVFISLYLGHQTLNMTVLLGCMIALGMVVDDSIVFLESIHHHLKKGLDLDVACTKGIREVLSPVICTVLTTIATFFPLMLLPGILGDFMFVLPFVVIIALILSLLEGWLLMPSHLVALRTWIRPESPQAYWRAQLTKKVQVFYRKTLVHVLRKPWKLGVILALLIMSLVTLYTQGFIKTDFFALEPSHVFYVDINLEEQTPKEETFGKVQDISNRVTNHLTRDAEMVYYSGIQFQESGVSYGSHLGQIMVSLNEPLTTNEMNELTQNIKNAINPSTDVRFRSVNDGPPVSANINAKITSHNLDSLTKVYNLIHQSIQTIPSIWLMQENLPSVINQVNIQFKQEALYKLGLTVQDVAATLNMYMEPILLKAQLDKGLMTHLRVGLASHNNDMDSLLSKPIQTAKGVRPLSEVITTSIEQGPSKLNHFNGSRMLEINMMHNDSISDLQASNLLLEQWESIAEEYPEVSFQFHGLIDDIFETLAMIPWVMALGLFLVYAILAVHFNSYSQPFIIFVTTPLALIGVLLGLVVSGYPLSVYALYGAIALIGIAVNSAILLISTANEYSDRMSEIKAIVYASKRRLLPIVVSSLTTMAGLSGLCFGFAGKSLLWGPVASAIFYGLGVSTILTLYCLPVLYSIRIKNNRN